MSSFARSKYFKGALLAALVTAIPSFAFAAGETVDKRAAADRRPWLGPVPKAHCARGDWTESGLQGQTTPDERYSGDSEGGYNCNLELVGQYQGEGAKSQGGPAYSGDCAYYATNNNPLQQQRGVVVIDASDRQHPRASAFLDTPTMLDPHESLKHNDRRKLIAAVENTGFNTPVPAASAFAIYDVSANCSSPVLQASLYMPGLIGHAGSFSSDGLTFYASHVPEMGMTVIDVSDPTQPTKLGYVDQLVHDVALNKDGTRAYVSHLGHYPAIYPFLVGPNGLVILDVSDYQMRRPNPQYKVISEMYWDDGGGVESLVPVTYNGRPYVLVNDEAGSDAGGIPASCARGLPPYGFGRIIDISDEKNPKLASKLMLEVNDPGNCPVVINDPADTRGSAPEYSGERCNVDRVSDPTMAACAYRDAGLRVFDISDPYRPREIAYYKPPAMRTSFLPGGGTWASGRDRTVDRVAGYARFHKVPASETHGRELEIWFVSDSNGFQIVRFSNGFKALHKDLMEKAFQKDIEN